MKRAVSRWPGRGLLRALRRDKRGVTVLEFAFVAPVLILILMFLFDTAYYLYARAILSGEVQAAGRASALETATQANRDALDGVVEASVKRLVAGGDFSFSPLWGASRSSPSTPARARQ